MTFRFVRVSLLLMAVVAVGAAPGAIGAQLNAGDILEIHFTTTNPVCPSGLCDVLELSPNEAGAFSAAYVTAKLFNGSSLLGTYSSPACCAPFFTSASSLFQAGSATVDFTAINAGTIQGVIQMSIASGYLTWPSAPTAGLTIGHATGAGFVAGGTGIQVQSVTILPASSPVPTTTALIAASDPVTFGAPIVLTANVNSTSATGKMTFYDGATILGTAGVSAGHAVLSLSLNVTGARRLYAHYSGDANFAGSTSPVVVQNVYSVPSFGFTSSSTAIGFYALGAAVGDFNGDGKADLVAVSTGNLIQVVLGNGDGTFGAPITSVAPAASGSLSFIVVSDFDGDGKPDIAGWAGDNTVKVLSGNGDGTFGGAISLPVVGGPITVADFNGDGVPDLAVAHRSTGSVGILLGNGDRTFAGPAEYPAGTEPAFLVAGDLNGDGKADLLSVPPYSLDGSGFITVVLGNGDGTFAPPISYSANVGALFGENFALGDLNGDGILDLVTTPGFGSPVFVLLGNGDGSFAPGVPSSFPSAPGIPQGPVIIDVNGDGRMDVVVASGTANELQIFYGNGDGTLQAPQIQPLPSTYSNLIPANFRGDGRVDFASPASSDMAIEILLGGLSPSLSIRQTHVGNFIQGGTGVSIITVSDATGAAPTSGSVVVTEVLSSGLMLTSMAGTGWTCSGTTCSRTDSLSPGVSYAPILVTASVAVGATSPAVNSATVSGGGSSSGEAVDSVALVAPLGPASITGTSGNPQSTAVGTAFPLPLVVTVRDSNGNPVSGATVTFSVSNIGVASGSFAGGVTTASTTASGIATSAVLTANGSAGIFTVTASVAGLTSSAIFTFTNTSGGIILPANVTVSVGQSVPFPITLSQPAPLGGTSITLLSSDSTKVSVTPAVLIATGAMAPSIPPTVTGIGLGTATITASGPGFAPVRQGVLSVDNVLFSPSGVTVIGNDSPTGILLTLSGALTSDLVINLSSTNLGVASVPPTVTIRANTTSVSVPVAGLQAGSAIIHASALPNVADTTLNVTVIGGLQITTPSLAIGQTGTPYSQTLTTSGGTPPFAWSLVSGTLPGGLSLSPSGVISGTPTTSATNLLLMVKVTDSGVPMQVAFGNLTLNIGPFTVSGKIILPANLTVNVGQSTTFPITLSVPAPPGGLSVTLTNSDPSKVNTPPSVFFIDSTIAPLIPIPVSGKGIGSATITASAPGYAPASQVISSIDTITFSPPSVTLLGTATQQMPLILTAANPTDLVVNLSSSNPAVVSVPPTVTFKANTTSVNVPVTSVGPSGSAVIHANALPFVADITANVTVIGKLGITTTSLANGQVGIPYSQILDVSGGTFPYTWSVVSGTLPSGLSLDPSTGVISGTPTAAVTGLALSVGVRDSSSPPQAATASLMLNIVPPSGSSGIILPANVTVSVGQSVPYPVTLSSPAPLGGVFITLVSSDSSKVTLASSISIPAGATVPPLIPKLNGIGLGSATITASAPGYSTVSQVVSSTDSVVFSASSLTITGTGTQQLSLILSAPLPADVVINLSSSNPAVASVPPTVTFRANTTSISVPVTGAGPGGAIIHASALPNIADTTANVTVTGGLGITTTSLPSGQLGKAYSQSLDVNGGTPPYTWSIVAGMLPNGLTLNPSTGLISGTPSAVATNTSITFKVMDSRPQTPQTASATLTLTITEVRRLPRWSFH